MKNILIILLLIFSCSAFAQTNQWIDFNNNGVMDMYEDPYALTDKRVNDLLSRMTTEEKILLLREVSPAIPRLGIAKYDHGNEALHGVVRPGKFTVFPQAIGLASTWNPDLIHEVASVISDEARAKWNEFNQGKDQKEKFSDLLAFWSPTVNMARDPRWGRTPETYGEDPYLTARIGVSFVKGLQGNDSRYVKVVSTPKHFAGNNEEHNRFECKMEVDEQTLRNYYLPAFKALVTEGKAESIMTAYNAINGIPCTANKWLLTDVLRNEWGFNGYVVSDCGAPGFLYSDHHYTDTREEAAQKAMKAGLDLECGGYCDECFIFTDYLPKAWKEGLVTDSEINSAAFRVLRARFKLGIFDPVDLNPYTKISPSVIGSEKHQELALETARQSIVLLKNNKNMLPLNKKKIKTMAVFGINAAVAEFGDYSGSPLNDPVSPLQGIIDKVGKDIDIQHIPWQQIPNEYGAINPIYFSHQIDGKTEKGLVVEYFRGLNFEGKPVVSTHKQILFAPDNQAPDPLIPNGPISIRWSGFINVPVTGKYNIGIESTGNTKLYLRDKLILEAKDGRSENSKIEIELVAGEAYPVVYEYIHNESKAFASLNWNLSQFSDKESFKKEKELAKKSDVVVAVLGINKSIEMEGRDRKSLNLPEDQMKFIQSIYAANKNIVVVLVAGSSMTINWIQENIPAIVNAWYPGEQGGTAIADILFGDYNPSGRLPLTYYASMTDLPDFNDYEISKGRTYMYLQNPPLYPFGFGLSYTTFQYSNIQSSSHLIRPKEGIEISIDIENKGNRNGAEVVQLYLQQPSSSELIPIKQLKCFKRIALEKGEKKKVSFQLSYENLSYWNKQNEFVQEKGAYRVMIGSSSADIREEFVFNVE